MAFDTSMYGQIRPIEVANPLTQYAQVAAIQQAQNQNRLADLVFGEKQRGLEAESKLGQLISAGGTPDSVFRDLAGAGFTDRALSYRKTMTDQEKAAADLGKVRAETAEKTHKLNKDKFEFGVRSAASLISDPQLSLDKVAAAYQQGISAGLIDPAHAEQRLKALPTDPVALRQELTKGLLSILNPEQQLQAVTAKPTEVDNGQQKFFKDTNPHSPTFGQMVGGAPVQKQITPGQAATLAQSERHFQAGQNAPQYMETEQGIVALPKKPVAGQPIVGEAVLGTDGRPLQKRQNIPQYVVQGLAENEKTAGVIEKALSQLQTPEGKNAVGLKGYLPQPILNRVDPQGVNTRADISDIGSMTVKDRSGATVTVAESPRLMPFIPSATDDDVTAGKKLRRMLQLIREDSEALTAFHPGAKAALDQVRAGKSAAPAETASASAPKPGTVMDGYKFKGGDPSKKSNWEKV